LGERGRRGTGARSFAAAALLGIAAALWSAVPAVAAVPAELLQIPPGSISPGGGAGELDNPRDVAADPVTGHIYVSELNNPRISEFTAWGQFVKAWGWDVAPGAVDEEQEVRVRASEGQFKLSFEGDSTPDLAFDASAAEVEAALEALPSIATGGGGVSVSGGSGADLRIYVVRFDAGALAGTDVAQLVAADGTTPLGGVPSPGVTVATRANGTPGGTGLEACTAASGCQAGSEGNGVGQFNSPRGVTVDASGGIYVYESPLSGVSRRVQKFDSAGNFLLMFGGGVNQGGGTPANPGNLCTAAHIANGDICGAGTSGTADGQFSSSSVGNFISYSPTANAILVGDKDRIQEFNLNGTFKGKIPFEGELEEFDQKTVSALDVDPASGDLYVAFASNPPTIEPVRKLDPSGALLGELDVPYPAELAVDSNGNVYVSLNQYSDSNSDTLDTKEEVLGFDATGSPREGMEFGDGFASPSGDIALIGLGTNLCAGSEAPGNLYVLAFQNSIAAYLKGYGTAPIGCEPPPPKAPDIEDQYAISVATDGASVQAQINPHFWPDTTYFVEYGAKPCSEGGCAKTQSSLLTSKSIDAPLKSAAVFLGGLAPDTTYHYRFIAQSSGGGPTIGAEASFTTFPEPTPIPPCANDEFRIGPSAKLPDCRAYEMVSPLEKGSNDILALFNSGLHQASSAGGKFTYTARAAFADPESSPMVSQYLAERHSGGWVSQSLNPPRGRALNTGGGLTALENEFKLFSPDLCQAWLRPAYDPPVTSDAVPGFINLYRRENCDAQIGSYETLTTVKPPQTSVEIYSALEVQGVTADGSHAIYVANDSLTEASPPNPKHIFQLYEKSAAGLRFVCILPDGKAVDPLTEGCYAGTAEGGVLGGATFGQGKVGNFENAISADGGRIFWTAVKFNAAPPGGPGRIYVRIDPDPGSEGDEETLDVSKGGEELSGVSEASRYWGAAEDGSKAIFTTGNLASGADLYRFDVDSQTTTLIAPEVRGVLGTTEDATHIYFASEAALPGSGQNSEGDEAQAGQPNLYLHEEGVGESFIATLAEADLSASGGPLPLAVSPPRRSARMSADGRHVAFTSLAPLTGYDNTDAFEGVPAAEVFVYDADGGKLRCASCNPSGARPSGRGESGTWAAALIPGWERALYASRALSADGSRLFFESYEALVLRDTNGQKDVYQWEEAGKGSCKATDSTFSAGAEGCVELISSGESPRETKFLDASPSGDDVFMVTLSSLVPPDYGLLDVYDARAGGGFEYPNPPVPCEGEACQSPPPPPEAITPASAVFEGPGNPKAKAKKRCPKGKHKVRQGGKTRCVKKSKKKQNKDNKSKKGRAGR
jgi:DNA-binding beta-propeller fold protein YncE